MSENVIIRKGRIADWKDAFEIWLQLVDYHRELADRPGFDLADDVEEQYRMMFSKHIRSRKSAIYIAERNGDVVGVVQGTIEKRMPLLKVKEQAMVEELAVREGERGKGIGKMLLDRFLEWTEEKDQEFAILYVIPENEPALKLYERTGFQTGILLQRKHMK